MRFRSLFLPCVLVGINVHLFIMEQQHFQSYETFIRTVDVSKEAAKIEIDCRVVSNGYSGSEKIQFQPLPGDALRITKESKVVARLIDSEGIVVSSVSCAKGS